MRARAGLCMLALLCSACAPAGKLSAPAPPDSLFIEKAQARLEAVAIGDTMPWRDTLARDGMFMDEESNVATAEELIGQIKPLPPGFSGVIKVVNPKTVRSGDLGCCTRGFVRPTCGDLIQTGIAS